MTETSLEYPDLYVGADTGSATAQRHYLRIVRGEYALLFAIAILSAIRALSIDSAIYMLLCLILLAGIFVYRTFQRLDEDWYRCRALAESVKTSTWRFSMRAHPFEDADSIEEPKAMFRNLLKEILKANRSLSKHLNSELGNQITESMLALRQLSVADRLAYYVENRVDEQRKWYAKKAVANRHARGIWIFVTISLFLIAGASLVFDPLATFRLSILFDPVIVLVTASLGWLQLKRHGELSASYNLTAHEIGIIRSNSDAVVSESELSEFVNEAELAFSREHTQWVARRDAA